MYVIFISLSLFLSLSLSLSQSDSQWLFSLRVFFFFSWKPADRICCLFKKNWRSDAVWFHRGLPWNAVSCVGRQEPWQIKGIPSRGKKTNKPGRQHKNNNSKQRCEKRYNFISPCVTRSGDKMMDVFQWGGGENTHLWGVQFIAAAPPPRLAARSAAVWR